MGYYPQGSLYKPYKYHGYTQLSLDNSGGFVVPSCAFSGSTFVLEGVLKDLFVSLKEK